jgi:hypothetical protein
MRRKQGQTAGAAQCVPLGRFGEKFRFSHHGHDIAVFVVAPRRLPTNLF